MTEIHPLEPFIPHNTQLLMLGSFPPPRKRWCMDFYYPNFQNDMWRIFGILFFGEKEHFITPEKCFDKEKIIAFLQEKGIAIYDTATEVKRLQDNASDKFLEVVRPTPIRNLLQAIPTCRAIVTTGQKATDLLMEQMGTHAPKVGQFTLSTHNGRPLYLYRMPSSSRTYPLSLDKKAAFYAEMFKELNLL